MWCCDWIIYDWCLWCVLFAIFNIQSIFVILLSTNRIISSLYCFTITIYGNVHPFVLYCSYIYLVIQKLNTKSSTESEVVGFSDYLPHNIQVKIFLQYQGYHIKNNVLYQDNQSAIRMKKNGRNSCTGNSRHIDIRYYSLYDNLDIVKKS